MRLSLLRPLLLSLALVLMGAVLPSGAVPGRSAALLDVESSAVYRLRPDQGTLHVALSLTVTIPASIAVDDRIELPVIVGATNLTAFTDDGRELEVRVPAVLGGPFTRVTVFFGQRLTSGEQITFHLDYDLREISLPSVFVSGSFVYAPILAIGDPATIELDLPDDQRWYSVVEPRDCERAGAVVEQRFTCTGSADVYVAAVVQLINQSQYRTLEGTVSTAGGAQTFQLRFEAGHDAWAYRVRDLAVSGLPRLESVIGAPLHTIEEFVLIEVQPTDLLGYEGVFFCLEEVACRIGVVSGASERVVLHELAHMWTTETEKRWLAEGLAEFAAQRVAREMGLPAEPPFGGPGEVQLYLDEWGAPLLSGGASEEDVEREIAGYRESVRLFEDVEARVGLDPMRAAIALADALDTVDSRAFLDLLEGASGADLTDLFRERVFPPLFSPVLDRRTQAKWKLAKLREDAAQREFELRTDPIDAAMQDWSFSVALDAIDDAYAFMDAYPAALEAKTHVSLWGRLGLVGKDPDGALDDAREQFDQGNFDRAAELARSAEHAYATASQSARDRSLVALAVAVLGGVVILGGTWAVRGGRV